MKLFKTILVLGAAGLGSILFIYLGVFNVAADDPHSKPVYWLLERIRERSITVRARSISVPVLDESAMIAAGGADYNEMCAGCHLQPGVAQSELAFAMNPRPPNLTRTRRDRPAETFWIIKHGVKMSGMPAWGETHDDQRIWAMVAFLQQLPRLTAAQYRILTARGAWDTEGHAHGSEDIDDMDHHGSEQGKERGAH